ncbi:hypothetical protein [Brevibacillus agri]|uniref:hypothetical protein n=1 Tax=Brevibacillus agri TaxID=51101 RepID=UPI0018CEC8D4|nr:hypothetical protein [Brevibacillus agri]MBG9565628.1 hypothetical protein [Brevibacillus agri]
MTSRSNKGNLLEADYTEDVVGFALDSFLTVANLFSYRVTIEPFSRGRERWLGADARIVNEITGFKPFYMQFKRPAAYPDYSPSDIIKTRKKLKLEISPKALFFGLREKDKNHKDYQHNILYKLRNRLRRFANSDAVYVCPLFLDRSAYRFHLHTAALRRLAFGLDPWTIGRVFIEDRGRKVTFSDVPILAEHVCIPPHDLVTSAKHRYSFSEKGTDLCFHSPLSLPEGIMTFGSWFDKLSRNLLIDDYLVNIDEATERLKFIISGDDDYENESGRIPYPEGLFRDGDEGGGLAVWSEWGRYLRETYSIHQYAFFIWKE